MKKLLQTIVPAALLSVGLMATATANAQTAQEAHASTVTTKQVTYVCSGKKPVKVTYGFNKQGLPTYAQAVLNGKARFMPINLAHSDFVGTHFGNENSYTLGTDAITVKNYKKSTILVTTPDNEIIYKNCKSRG
ncbi:adhesin [Moraxella sp. ZY210820]|uniref:ACP-like domain-containing protein n=1 Tax=unclassified Moraxella TaxID=2685852 RepID=UPI0027305B0B|nr:adhesin [Moraxella sp. ZY210820]WLF83733.1 adhesin [Moraxella sp. ZY210820]